MKRSGVFQKEAFREDKRKGRSWRFAPHEILSLSLSLSLSLFSFFSFATIFLTLFSRDISEGEVFQMEIPIARQVAVWKTEIDRRAGVFILRRYSTYILHIFSGSSIEREANVENEKEGEEERRRKKRESQQRL